MGTILTTNKLLLITKAYKVQTQRQYVPTY